MNKYESVVIIDPAVEEDKVKELSQKFTEIMMVKLKKLKTLVRKN